MLRVYISDTAPLEDEMTYLRYYEAVSEKRKMKTDRMKVMQGRILSVGVEALLIRACSDAGFDYTDLETDEEKNGKPFFVNAPGFHFSLSHSGCRVMCAVSDANVGCDTERETGSNLKIAGRFFSSAEFDYLKSLGTEKERREAFGRLWTLKESFMKVTGLGFTLPLKDFSIDISSDPVTVNQSVSDIDYCFYEIYYDDGYRYSVCSECEEVPEIYRITL